MTITVIQRSDKLPVALAIAKLHAAIEDPHYDLLVSQYIKAAAGIIELRTKRVAIPATFRQTYEAWGSADCPLELSRYPVRAITGVNYADADDVNQVIASSNYSLTKTPRGGELWFSSDYSLPRLSGDRGAPVWVEYEAGYDIAGEAADSPPDPAAVLPAEYAQAILSMVAHWYRNREAVVVGTSAASMPDQAADLIHNLRIF